MSELRLYNTRTRQKEVFTPADPGRVTMYVCGPTVYGRAHIGNARPAVVFDVLARLLRHRYGEDSLVYARNITDIDDKIMAAAAAEGVAVDGIAARYEAAYVADMAALGVAPPTLSPHATHHVPGMVAMIGELIARGVAYEANGHVLFSVAADPEYGTLSGRDRAAMLAGARVEVAAWKRDAADFVLWKPSAEDQPGWDSPWGRGRPGWHIECSAMIRELLGETIDIHGGGQDLIFPHHENEAAQSRSANGAELARVWMHNGFLSMGADKMSKSLGNVVSVGELLEQGWDGEVIRLALLSAHYRQPLEWTDTLLSDQHNALESLRSAVYFEDSSEYGSVGPDDIWPEFIDALADDIDISKSISFLHGMRRAANRAMNSADDAKSNDDLQSVSQCKERHRIIARALYASGQLLGLNLKWELSSRGRAITDEAVAQATREFIQERDAARAARDFATADRIRDELEAQGILLEDKPDGTTTWRRA